MQIAARRATRFAGLPASTCAPRPRAALDLASFCGCSAAPPSAARVLSGSASGVRGGSGGGGGGDERARGHFMRVTAQGFPQPMTSAWTGAMQSVAESDTPRYPTLEECRGQARELHEMSGHALLLLSATGHSGARVERMIREVMLTDGLEYLAAVERVDEMNVQFTALPKPVTLANEVLGSALAAGGLGLAACSIPMVFHKSTSYWFNDTFVGGEPPPPDLGSWLEVGSWTWSWNEPMIGTFSFVVLCIQLARPRYDTLITSWLRERRLRRLLGTYPQYAPMILVQWADALRDRETHHMELLSPGSIGPRAEQDRRDRAARTAEEAAGAHKIKQRWSVTVADDRHELPHPSYPATTSGDAPGEPPPHR